MKALIRTLATLALAGTLSPAFATGIPTVSITEIAQLLQQYVVLQNQYTTMVQQYATMRDQLANSASQLQAITGSRNLGQLFSNPAVQSALPPDWRDVYTSIRNTATFATERAKYPTSSNASVNAIYDQQAIGAATLTDFFNRANARIAQLAQLQSAINTATDPAAKQDLANRFVHEQNSIQQTTQLLGILQQKQAADLEVARQHAQDQAVCTEFKNCP